MNNLIIIAAIGKNNELGRKNELIWRTKEDMNFFKTMTSNHHIVMGRKTFDSLPHILPNRKHIVITNSNIQFPNDVIKCSSIEEFTKISRNIDDDIYVIGGAQIYSELIDNVDIMYLTEFDAICKCADVYFPQIKKEEWSTKVIASYEHTTPKYLRKIYTRKK